jgi:hypothetical protein
MKLRLEGLQHEQLIFPAVNEAGENSDLDISRAIGTSF